MSSLFVRRSRGLFVSVAALGLLAACMQQPASAPPPSSPPPPPAASAPPPPLPSVVTVKRANFRAGPSTKAPIIATLPAGTVALLVGPAGGVWEEVSYQNRLGYIYGKLVRNH